ncbi:hypothetical protein Tco_1146881 [Tanacetum coccineum]
MLVMTAVGGVGGSEVVVPRWGWRLFGGGDVCGVVGEGDERDGGEGGGRLAEDRPKVGRKVRGGEEEDMWRLEYMEYEAEIKRDPWGYAQSYTRSSGSTTLKRIIDMLEGLNEIMLLGRPLLATIHAQIVVFRREILLGIGEEKGKFDINGGICHSRVPVEIFYMASSVQESKNFNPLEIENDIFSYDSPACLLLERGTPSCSEESIDTVDSSHDMQELEGKRVLSHTWICFQDHERQNVGGNGMIFDDFLKVRYENKNIDDVTRERRYYEWVVQNYDFNVKSRRDTEDNSFEEWVKIKLGHTNVSETIKCEMFKEWIKENFNFEVDFGRTRDDSYSRRFDVYKEEFDNEIEQLKNEYELKAKRKRYALDEVWEKCEKFHDTTKLWYDKGFEEKELWQNRI